MTQTLAEAVSRAPLSHVLTGTIGRALGYARHQAHRRVTLEHLLLALTEDSDAMLVLTASNIDLRRLAVDVSSYVGRIEDRFPPGAVGEPQADADFMSIIEYATAAARQSNRREINGAIVLAAIVGEGRSPAATMLRSQGLTFEEAIKALQRTPTLPTQPAAQPQQHQPQQHQPQPLPTQPPQQRPGGPPTTDDLLAQARSRIPQIRPVMQPAAVAPRAEPPAPAQAPAPQMPVTYPAPAPVETRPEPAAPMPPALPPQPQPVQQQPLAPAPAQPPMYAPDPRGIDDGYGRMPPAPPPQQPAPQSAARDPRADEDLSASDDVRFRVRVVNPQINGDGREPGYQPQPTYPAPTPMQQPPQGAGYDAYDDVPRTQPPQSRPPSYQPQPSGPMPVPPQAQQPYPPQRQPPPNYGYAPQGPERTERTERPPERERTYPPGQGRPQQAPPGAYPPAGYAPQQQPQPPPQQRAPAPLPPMPQQPPVVGKPLAPGQLIENIPRRMRVGVTETVEVRIAREHVQNLSFGMEGRAGTVRHDLVVSRAMSVRLKASEGGFFIESASPETQWIESRLGLVSDDFASWRWSITPQRRGAAKLQLVIAARTVGVDGLAAESVLPDQVIDIAVTTNYAKTAQQAGGWAAAAVAGGLLGKFGDSLWAVALGLIGRGG